MGYHVVHDVMYFFYLKIIGFTKKIKDISTEIKPSNTYF